MKNLRVLTLVHPQLLPPENLEGTTPEERYVWKTEWDVISTLRASGHEVKAIGVLEDLGPIRDAIEDFKPDIVFNLLEEFQGETLYAQNVVGLLELLRTPYTGCNPRGMMLARGKDLSKKLLKYHRIPVPAFAVFPIGRAIKRPAKLAFPLIVKSLNEDASRGISQASVVDSDERLVERVTFIHERIRTPAIAEQYIDGREIYVGVIGNDRKQALPIWELEFGELAPGQFPIATEHVKHNPKYQERRSILQGPADNLPPAIETRIRTTATRICRTLEIDGYARIDFRLTPDGTPYFIEANPNPEIASTEEFAQAALHAGIEYPELLNRIVTLGLKRVGAET
ncbi:MAG: D-alanine--D-alanine ligase [Hyphomonadaceae bacterium]